MPNQTTINWTDKSSNIIRARNLENGKTGHFCTKKNAKCNNCYAEKLNRSFMGNGLKFDTRNVRMVEFFFAEKEAENLRRLNARMAKQGKTIRVFLGSMTDIFQETMPFGLIRQTFQLIKDCSNVIFQTLTKRIEVAARFFALYPEFQNLPNLHFGLTPEDDGSDIKKLLDLPLSFRWLSLEPLLKGLELDGIAGTDDGNGLCWNWAGNPVHVPYGDYTRKNIKPPKGIGIDWIVVGGESGQNARPTNLHDIHDIVMQCFKAGVPVWVKQLGKVPMMLESDWQRFRPTRILNYKNHKKIPSGFVSPLMSDSKGGNFDEFPNWLKFRELPS